MKDHKQFGWAFMIMGGIVRNELIIPDQIVDKYGQEFIMEWLDTVRRLAEWEFIEQLHNKEKK